MRHLARLLEQHCGEQSPPEEVVAATVFQGDPSTALTNVIYSRMTRSRALLIYTDNRTIVAHIQAPINSHDILKLKYETAETLAAIQQLLRGLNFKQTRGTATIWDAENQIETGTYRTWLGRASDLVLEKWLGSLATPILTFLVAWLYGGDDLKKALAPAIASVLGLLVLGLSVVVTRKELQYEQ